MPSPRRQCPIPYIPPKTKIPLFKVTSKPAGHTEVPSALSFYYAGIQEIWLWYRVPLSTLRAYVEPLGMTPYDFGGRGAVNLNFFNAACMYGSGQPGNQGVGGFNETELNIVSYATKVADKVPFGFSLHEFLTVGDPTKRLGNYRVWVACDDPVAVACGRQVFMENKFVSPYTYDVPMLNNPKSPGHQFTWHWTCHDDTRKKAAIYTATVDLAGLSSVPGNMSEVIDLSFDPDTRRPVGSRRNYFGMFDTYLGNDVAGAAKLRYGASKHPMRHDLQRLIGRARPSAIQVFVSPPCIAEAAGFCADE